MYPLSYMPCLPHLPLPIGECLVVCARQPYAQWPESSNGKGLFSHRLSRPEEAWAMSSVPDGPSDSAICHDAEDPKLVPCCLQTEDIGPELWELPKYNRPPFSHLCIRSH